MVNTILRAEGLAIFLASLGLYYLNNGSWLLFIILLFAPDISMAGYFVNRRLGAITYNLLHNLVLPIIIGGVAWFLRDTTIMSVALILLAHVGMDRLFGYGLKYPNSFKQTHMQKV